MTDRNQNSALLSPADSDALYTLKVVAAFWGMTPGQAKPFVEAGILPTFRLPGSTVLCASKSAMKAAWHQHEAEWRDRHPIPDIREKLRQRKHKRELKLNQSAGLSNNPVNGRPIANAGAEEKTCGAA